MEIKQHESRNGKKWEDHGEKAGVATITAKANGKTATCKVKVTNVISYTYRYSYSINDFGKYVMNDPYKRWTVKVTPISSTKIKLLFCQNKKEETYTAVKESKNRYVYIPKNGIYPGYKQVVIWEKEKKRFIFKGEEAGSSYFFEVK